MKKTVKTFALSMIILLLSSCNANEKEKALAKSWAYDDAARQCQQAIDSIIDKSNDDDNDMSVALNEFAALQYNLENQAKECRRQAQ